MKICYLTESIIPSFSADSVNSMRMCNGFAQAGHEVTLVVPDRPLPVPVDEEPHAYYGVSESFRIEKIPWRLIAGRSYYYGLRAALHCRRLKPDLVYSRANWEAMFSAWLGMPTVFEAHMAIGGRVTGRLFSRLLKSRQLKGIVSISNALKQYLVEEWNYPSERIVIGRDAADVVEVPPLDFAVGRRGVLKVGYAGMLVPGRGIELLFELAGRLPNIDFHILGGTPGQVDYWKRQNINSNVYFHGGHPPRDVPRWLQACDIVVAPYGQKVTIGLGEGVCTTNWASPMKLFEYMAAGKAIICSDLPVLREFMRHEENALLCPPGHIELWTRTLNRLVADPMLRNRLGARALDEVHRKYSWRTRAEKVLQELGLSHNPSTGSLA
jgi:glycosyltransferase involved in cell wall biosynthesis